MAAIDAGSGDTPDDFEGLTRLPVPVPAGLAEALGYNGHSPILAMYFDPAADVVVFEDGRIAGSVPAEPWRLFMAHPAVVAAIEEFDFRHTDSPPPHALLLDRVRQRLYVLPFADTTRSLARLRSASSRRPSDVIEPLIGDQREAIARMLAFLDGAVDLGGECEPDETLSPAIVARILHVDVKTAATVVGLINGEIPPGRFESVRRWLDQCFNPPDRDELIMCALDEVLGGFGVEVINAEEWLDSQHGHAIASYCNLGDTYTPTVIHEFESGAYHYTSLGDFVEAVEAEGRQLK